MKRLLVRQHGPPDSIETEEVDLPEPGPGEVRVAVHAVGLNHLDLWVRRGVEGHRFPLPLVPGSDIAGVVDTGPRQGERVALHPATSCMACAACMSGNDNRCGQYRIRGERQDGGCAQFVVCHERDLLPLPEGMAFTDARLAPVDKARRERRVEHLVQCFLADALARRVDGVRVRQRAHLDRGDLGQAGAVP